MDLSGDQRLLQGEATPLLNTGLILNYPGHALPSRLLACLHFNVQRSRLLLRLKNRERLPSLRMDMLRSRTPEGVYKEVFTRLAAHNLIRYTMAQAATHWNLPLVRISFKGSVDALRQFTHAMACARSQKKRQELWTELLETLAADLVPERPGRREPRAVKRKKNRYPRLRGPRRRFRDCLKRNKRRTLSRLRKLGLK